MSFDVYLQSFHNGEPAGIPSQRIRDAFGAHLTEIGPNFWQLRYDDANWCDLDLTAHETDATMISDFTVHRPCSDQRLWDALASILASGDIVLYFPGCRAPLVAQSAVIDHLPASMVEALGQPVIVTSGREIQEEIHAALLCVQGRPRIMPLKSPDSPSLRNRGRRAWSCFRMSGS
jgi:hypothetical protein